MCRGVAGISALLLMLALVHPLQGMSLVPAVTELVLAEMLYLQVGRAAWRCRVLVSGSSQPAALALRCGCRLSGSLPDSILAYP